MVRTLKAIALFACCAALAPAHAYFTGPHLDLSYGSGGTTTIRTTGSNFHVFSMHAGRNGALAVLYIQSASPNGGATIYTVSRLLHDGTFDTTFGQQGKTDVTRIGGLPSTSEFRPDVVFTDREGRMLLGGQHMDHAAPTFGRQPLMLARLKANGTPDEAFGSAGAVIVPLPQPAGDLACSGYVTVSGIAQRADGKLLVHGTRRVPTDFNFSLNRCMFLALFNPDGSRAEDFGTGGIAETALTVGAALQSGTVQPDGGFEALGTSGQGPFGGSAGGGYATWKTDARGRTISSTVAPWDVPPQRRVYAQAPAAFVEIRTDPPPFPNVMNKVTLEVRHADRSMNTTVGRQGVFTGELEGEAGHSFAAMTPDGGAVATGVATESLSVPPTRHHLCVWRSDGQVERCGPIAPHAYITSSTSYLAPDGSLYISNNYPVPLDDGIRAGYIGRFNVTAPIVEFYNVPLAHFYMTYDGVEARWIDSGGAGAGWMRTGQSFKSGGTDPACMFYGTPGIGPNSHFYTINPAECEWVKLDPGWTFIAMSFYASPPAGGQCAPPLRPIHRLYNNRAAQNDSNHRYIKDLSLADGMIPLGWTYDGVVFCARP